MRISSSGVPSDSLVQELKSLLEVVSNADKAKAVLMEVEAAVKDLDGAREACKGSADEVQAMATALKEAEVKYLAEIEQMKKDKEALNELAKKLNAANAEGVSKEAELSKAKTEFEEFKKATEERLSEKESAADLKMKDAMEMKSKADDLAADYETKAAKLKAMVGA